MSRTEKLEDRMFATTIVWTYEQRLDADLEWAMSEGSRFFQGQGAVQEALRKITSRLEELGIAYAVVGGMALFAHGFRRFTEDVDLLVTRDGLSQIHRHLEGRGYRPPFEGSKNLRDTENGVKIEFLTSGDYPGDGRPKPVAFPDPLDGATERNGIRYINLETLIELKLASGLSNADRMKDLADVVELIKVLNLEAEYSKKLNSYVRDKYLELWQAANPERKKYMRALGQEFAQVEAETLEELLERCDRAPERLREMLADGVKLESVLSEAFRRRFLTTTNPAVARKYGMHEESEFLLDRDDD